MAQINDYVQISSIGTPTIAKVVGRYPGLKGETRLILRLPDVTGTIVLPEDEVTLIEPNDARTTEDRLIRRELTEVKVNLDNYKRGYEDWMKEAREWKRQASELAEKLQRYQSVIDAAQAYADEWREIECSRLGRAIIRTVDALDE